MAEFIGIIASAYQLADLCVSIWNLIHNTRTCKSTLLRYQGLLQELQRLSNTIINNKIFHTSDIRSLITSILDTVPKITSLTALSKRPYILRVLVFLNEKKVILEAFEVIEKKKTSLFLHMQLIQADLLHEIRSQMPEKKRKRLQKVRPNAEKAQIIETVETKLCTPTNNQALNSTNSPAFEMKSTPNLQLVIAPSASSNISTSEISSNICLEGMIRDCEEDEQEHNMQEYEGKKYHQMIDNQVLDGKGDQVHGLVVEGVENLPRLPQHSSTALYLNNKTTATASGNQVFGSQFEIRRGQHGGILDLSGLPELRGRTSGNHHHGSGKSISGYHIVVTSGAPN